MPSDTTFEQEFTARFGDAAWLVVFGADFLSFAAEIDFQDDVEDGLVEFWAWPTPDKNFVFRINPKNVMKKEDQWEVSNVLDGRRWAIRTLRPDQEANRG